MSKGPWIISIVVIAGAVLAGARVFGVAQQNTSADQHALSSQSQRALDSSLNKQLLVRINAVRKRNALRPLTRSVPLFSIAGAHTTEMGRAGYFDHASLDRTAFWKRIEQKYPSAGYRAWDVGENLLFVAPNVGAAEAMRRWMASPEHRANILDPDWREVGIASHHFNAAPGVYGEKPVTILTSDFGARRK